MINKRDGFAVEITWRTIVASGLKWIDDEVAAVFLRALAKIKRLVPPWVYILTIYPTILSHT